MSTEENKAFMRRFIETGNKQDMEEIWESIDPHNSSLTFHGWVRSILHILGPVYLHA